MFVVIPKISSGSVLSLPAVSSVRANSSYESVKPNSAIPTMPGATIGSTTCRNTCHGLAPRSRAASSHRRSKRFSTANMISSPNGKVQVSCAPNAELYQSGSQPARLNSRPTPRLTRMDGTIRLATVSMNSTPAPGNRLRNAIPAATEITTVAAITITPSITDRCSAPPISPTACCSNSRTNQRSETPFIGKVRPPSGPWNDRIMMVSVGPYRNSTNTPKNTHRASRPYRRGTYSSLRTSTTRTMAATSSSTTASSTTALAQAAGYCSSDTSLLIISPTEALCPPLISRTVMKSPITSVTTKIEPIAIPGLHSGTMTSTITRQALQPASVAASISRRSILTIVLNIGATMNSVYKCTNASTTAKLENSRNSSGAWITPIRSSAEFSSPLRPRKGTQEIMRMMLEVRNGTVHTRNHVICQARLCTTNVRKYATQNPTNNVMAHTITVNVSVSR